MFKGSEKESLNRRLCNSAILGCLCFLLAMNVFASQSVSIQPVQPSDNNGLYHLVTFDYGGEDTPEGCVSHIDNYAACLTERASGFSAKWIAWLQRSLSAKARKCTTCSPVRSFQREPGRFILSSKRLLHVASTLPLPIGRPALRADA